MNDNELIRIFLASSLGGIVYWLYLYGQYMFNDFSNSIVPYDALFILLPIIIFTWVGCFFILIPIYLLLKKLKKTQLRYIIMLAPLCAVLIQAVIMWKWTVEIEFYFGSFLAGIIGGAFFYYLINKDKSTTKI